MNQKHLGILENSDSNLDLKFVDQLEEDDEVNDY